MGNDGRQGGSQSWLVRVAVLLAVLGAIPGAGPAAAGSPKRVACALPVVQGKPALTCSGLHRIQFITPGYDNNTDTISAELLALDQEGNVLESVPVNNGDLAQIASRLSPKLFKVDTVNNLHTIVAPMVMLHVTADDGSNKQEAYCSNIPLLQILQPNSSVASLSSSDVTKLLVAIPQVDPSHLVIKVDGVDIFARLGIANPVACSPTSPCGGTVQIKGSPVTVSGLVVDSAGLGRYGANTVVMEVTGLGCGGHLFAVHSAPRPGALSPLVGKQCHVDPVSAQSESSGFGVSIAQPTSGEAGLSFPVEVTGQVCGGRPIATLQVAGADVSTAGQVLIPGDGTTSADTYTLSFDLPLAATDLKRDLTTGDAPFGALDDGSNRLVVAATDDLGNRAFSTVIFATDTTGNPGVTGTTTVQIGNAFVVGLSPAAVQQHFTQRCTDPVSGVGKKFADTVTANILAKPTNTTNVQPTCSCDVNDIPIKITSVDIDPTQITCTVTPQTGKFHVSMDLPNVIINASATGSCEDDVGDLCIDRTVVNVTSTTTITGINMSFDITENQILTKQPPLASATAFVSGTSSTTTTGGVSIECIGGEICDVLLTALTLGLVDFTPQLDITNVQSFSQQVGNSQPDPIGVNDISVDPDVVSNFNQSLSAQLTSVHIDVNGLLAALTGSFTTDSVDPTVQPTPGALISSPPAPTMPVSGASDAFIVVSTDALNQMFGSMTLAGTLQTSCQPSGKTLADFLPADCDSLTNPAGDTATAIQQGTCHALRLDDCEALVGSTTLLTAVKQGSCHGARGDNCNAIPVAAQAQLANAEKSACNATPNQNLRADQSVLLCTRQDIPPRLLPISGGGNSAVQSALRLKSLSVAMILDRNDNGLLDGELETTPPCLAAGSPKTGDCNLYEACLDLNFNFDMQLETCSDGKPGFVGQFTGVQTLARQAGVVCSGSATVASDGAVLDQSSSNDIVTSTLPNQAQTFFPPICMKGLDLSNFVTCSTPKLLVVETNGDSTYKDYLGITCAITAP